MSTRARRRIAIVCIAAGLLAIAIEIYVVHDRSITVFIAPFAAVVFGTEYLRATRGRR
jgi:hypothetical protein